MKTSPPDLAAADSPTRRPVIGFLLPAGQSFEAAGQWVGRLTPALTEFDGVWLVPADVTFAPPEGVTHRPVRPAANRGAGAWASMQAAWHWAHEPALQGLDALVVFDTATQRALALWRTCAARRRHLIRVWLQDETLPASRLDRLLLGKRTAINIQLGFERPRQPTDPARPGVLELDNPFYLPDGPVLGDEGVARLAGAFRALFFPTRRRGALRPATDWSHIRLTYITHFYLNQERTDSITALLEDYARYPADVLDAMHFVIVDDGSPIECPVPDHLDLNLTWLRIDEDIRWNQGGARNLGVVYAKSDNILITDLDLAFPPETLRALIQAGPCGKNIYKFYERDPVSKRLQKGHPNNFFLSRSRFLRFYGYDEEFAGNYGAEDFRFIKFQKAQGTRVRYFDSRYTFLRRAKLDRKKSYHSLVRDLSDNTPIDSRKREEIAKYGHEHGHSRMFLEYPWRVLGVRRRSRVPQAREDAGWKRRWLLRALLPW
jgi:hypothetical protein